MRILAGVLALLVCSGAQAQVEPRYELGIGAGVANVSQSEGLGDNTSAAVNVSLGYRIGAGTRLVLESALFGTRDQDPQVSDLRMVQNGTPGIYSVEVVRRPEVFQVLSAQLGVQLPLGPSFYARPSVGMARHAFPSYLVGATTVEAAETSHEWGLAAGLAIGHGFRLSGVRLDVEGVAHWSGGEDSSPSRTAVGLRIVPRFAL